MSVSHFDEIKSRYGFRELNVATWKDPKLSVHPFRGGPKPVSVSPESVSKPFTGTYRVRIRPPPEPTDDEESEDDEVVEDGKKEDVKVEGEL